MFKPLDRNIAIVVAETEVRNSGAALSKLAADFLATSQLFALAQLTTLNPNSFDAIVLSEFDLSDLPGVETKSLAKTLRTFHSQSKPIGAIGKSVRLVAGLFAAQNVEVTAGEDLSSADEIVGLGATHTPCPVNDYVSDRDNKTLTTPGSLGTTRASHRDTQNPQRSAAVEEGVRKMVRELIEMA